MKIQEPVSTGFLETANTQGMNYVFRSMLRHEEEAEQEEKIGLIHGNSGMGKTYVMERLVKQSAGILFLEIVPPLAPKGLMVLLCRRLKLRVSGTCEELTERIFSHLKTEPCLLVIDEAEHLRVKSLEWLRRLSDLTKAKLLLIGTEKLHEKIAQESLEQLRNRIDIAWPMSPLEPTETACYCKERGIADHKTAHTLSQGNFRKLARLIKRTQQFAKDQSKAIAEISIKDVAKFLPAFN